MLPHLFVVVVVVAVVHVFVLGVVVVFVFVVQHFQLFALKKKPGGGREGGRGEEEREGEREKRETDRCKTTRKRQTDRQRQKDRDRTRAFFPLLPVPAIATSVTPFESDPLHVLVCDPLCVLVMQAARVINALMPSSK